MINPSDAEGPHQTADALRQKIWPCVVQLLIHDYNIGGPGPKPLGSAVLVRIQEEIFLFSAAHVLAGFKCGLLLVAVGDEAVLELPALSVFATGSSEMGNHQLDPIDAAVAHIPKCFARSLIPRAYDLSGIDFSEREEHDWFLILGYPANRTDIDLRIPRHADHHSELMSIMIPK